MNKLLSLILITGTIPVSSLFLTSQSASAFCVYNRSAYTIRGEDTRFSTAIINRHWGNTLNPGEKDCCPGSNTECQNATIQIRTTAFPVEKSQRICKVPVGARQALVISNQNNKVTCRVN